MEFVEILQKAQKNSSSKNGSNFYKTKFDPPKKEAKAKTLSSNIQKFLAKKEEEERRRAEETRRQRDDFLAMRDQKTTNKIRKMLKVTKSANRSVLDDAVDAVNTSVTMHGPEQPDEDDYGYVSQEASAFYSKMMEKYKNIPDEEKFSSRKSAAHHDLSSTKDRVRAAILRQREEETTPHKRKRKSHVDDDNRYGEAESSRPPEKKEERPKPKRPPPPPPMDFKELLKIAEKKQFEPVVIEPKKPEIVDEPERLMTKKQKREYEELKAYKEARQRRERERASQGSAKPDTSKSKSEPQSKPANPSSMRIPKLSDKTGATSSSNKPPPTKLPEKKISESQSKPSKPILTNATLKSAPSLNARPSSDGNPQKAKIAKSDDSKPSSANESKLKNALTAGKSDKTSNDVRKSSVKSHAIDHFDNRLERKFKSENNNNKQDRGAPSSKPSPSSSSSSSMAADSMRRMNPGVSSSSAKLGDLKKPPLSSSQKTRQFPPDDVQRTRQFPPPDVKRSRPPMSREEQMRRDKLKKRRIMDDDDSEYDSSLEDFIDDGPENGEDVSSYIKEIFGYDKARYKDMDDDDRNMESNFSQVMREEFISKKIGIMEDLEDMKMEAMEKKRKMMMKKKASKK